MNIQRLSKKEYKYYQIFFWIVYGSCIGMITHPISNLLIDLIMVIMMFMITVHFWARSDYYQDSFRKACIKG